jgi:carbonic anhydrase/acetyltransferase-like protein (isoleucine patch superfamily)
MTMPIYALGDSVPEISPEAFVHPDAVVIGQVSIGAEATVWPGAVLRGDHGRISIGRRTSIQDGSVIHCTAELDTRIGADCTVGHLAHLEGCTVEDGALVGSGATVLHRAVVGKGALVAAQALVPPGTSIPAGALARGVPARIVEGGADPELIAHAVRTYVHNAHWYAAALRRLDG